MRALLQRSSLLWKAVGLSRAHSDYIGWEQSLLPLSPSSSAEQGVIVDVMYLSVYLVWHSPQVLVSTSNSESEFSFISSVCKHTVGVSQGAVSLYTATTTHT